MGSFLLTLVGCLFVVVVLFGGAIIISDSYSSKQLRNLATIALVIMSLVIFIGVPIFFTSRAIKDAVKKFKIKSLKIIFVSISPLQRYSFTEL